MLQLEQQGIEGALVDGEEISADLLDAAGDAVAVLVSEEIECLEDHQGKRTLQDVGLFLHFEFTFRVGSLPFWFPTGMMTCFLLESNRNFGETGCLEIGRREHAAREGLNRGPVVGRLVGWSGSAMLSGSYAVFERCAGKRC